MTLTIRACTEADLPSIEALQWPEPPDHRRLFGLVHTGALIETTFLSLCVCDAVGHVVAFAAFDNQVPTSLAKWPEATEYLKKKVHFGRSNGCVLLSAFRQDPNVPHARVVAELAHFFFSTQSEMGGIVLPVPVGVDLAELGLFDQAFSCYDSISLSTGALFRFYRAVRVDYTPSVYVRDAQPSDVRTLQSVVEAQQMEWRLAGGASYHAWFNGSSLTHAVASQDEHHACYVAQSLTAQAPAGLLACTDAIQSDKVDEYAKLFSELYRTHVVAPSQHSGLVASRPPSQQAPPKIVLCGPTGSGKGTQSQALVNEFNLVHLSTGIMLRWHIEHGTALGLQAQNYIDSGELVPDELILDMVLKRLNDDDCRTRGWVLDGFPRTEMQARVMVSHGALPDVVAVMSLADEEVIQRLCPRRIDPETERLYHLDFDPPPASRADHVVQRLEDREDHVRRRLAMYHAHMEPVFQVFMKNSMLRHMDAARTKESISRKLTRDVYTAKKTRRPLRLRHAPKLVMAGPPAGGKGTQCEWIVQGFDVVHLSTGDMLRAAIQEHKLLGVQAKQFMDAGQLVPDELIIDLILDRLQQGDCLKRGWLLDGFPRTKAQAKAMLAKGIVPDAMLVLDVPDEEIVQRISGRVLDPDTGRTYHQSFNPPPTSEIAQRCIQRSVDTVETARVRLQSYHDNCDQVREAFRGVCEVTVADGTQPIEAIAEQFFRTIETGLLRNNAFVVDLFSMRSDHECRAQLLLTKAFQTFKDKDCLLLALPEGCQRPVITMGFRSVRVDPTISSVHCIQLRRNSGHGGGFGLGLGLDPPVSRLGSKKTDSASRGPRQIVLYAFHRDELPFLSFSGSELLTVDGFDTDGDAEGEAADHVGVLWRDESQVRGAEESHLVVVKGLGLRGLTRTVKAWTQRTFFGGSAAKQPSKRSEKSKRSGRQ